MSFIDTLVIHCSDSPSDRGDSAETIHQWHKEKGWDGIGYHYVIDGNGIIEHGRPEYWEGAHVKGHNKNSLGICLIGKGDYTTTQFLSLIWILKDLTVKYSSAMIYEHNYFNPDKLCPMLDIKQKDIIKFFFPDKYIEKL